MTRLPVVALTAAVFATAALPAAAAAPRGSMGNAYPIRTTAPLGQGWRLRVNRAIPNASLTVLGDGTYAVRPGKQFFLVNVTASYSGKGSHAVFSAYDLSGIGRGGLVYTQLNDNCGVVRGALNDFKRVSAGSQVTGNVCFWVRPTDARVLLLKYQPPAGGKAVFFKLRQK